MNTLRVAFFAFVLAGLAGPASAQLPEPVRAMIEAAISGGDAAKIKAVVEVAKQTNPDDAAEIDELHGAFLAKRRALAAAEEVRKEEDLRSAGLFQNWDGTGQVGAFHTSGNSDNTGVTLSLALNRTGIDWHHKLRATADYQRSNGRTSREQLLLSYEPRIQLGADLFSYALAQYESDRFQGFDSRYSMSGGFGYKLLDSQAAKLSVKLGPSWRRVDYTDGTSDNAFGALAGMDFDWQLANRLKLTQDANLVADAGSSAAIFVDSTSTSVLLTTGLEAKVSDSLTTRLSYTVDYDSNPPTGAVSTDTLSRFTLVYGF